MLSTCWGIPDVTQWFWWLHLRGWCYLSVPVSYADFICIPYFSSVPRGGNILCRHLKSTVSESNPHTIQELKDNIDHTVAAIKITVLYRLYRNMIRRMQLCIDAGANHLHHLLWWYILSAFGCCINFCIYAMIRTRSTFLWPILHKYRDICSALKVCSNPNEIVNV